jgi:hypothetical protein
MEEIRKKFAVLVRKLYAGEISFDDFLSEAPEQDQDGLIGEIVDLIEHEPQNGGFLGVSNSSQELYMQQIFSLIEKLEQ